MTIRRQPRPLLARLARLLGVPVDDMRGLDDVPDEDLETLYQLIGRAIFADHHTRLARVAGLSQVLPTPVAGKLAERFLAPALGARVTELLEPAKARELAQHVSVRYLADLTLALDPTRSAPVVRAISAERVRDIARELFARRQYVAMAELAGVVNPDALYASVRVATAHDLLSIVPLVAWTDAMDRVVERIPDAQLDDILTAIARGECWDEGNLLVERLRPDLRDRVAERANAVDDAVVDAFQAAADAGLLSDTARMVLRRAQRVRAEEG